MADSVKVTVTGMSDVKKALEALKKATSDKMLENAVIAGALPIQNAAKQKAPKRTSTLRRSIHIGGHTDQAKGWKTGKNSEQYNDVGQNVAKESYAEVVIGTDLEYAAIQEFGGTITPKNGKYLAVPLTKAAEAAVSPLNFPGDLHPVFMFNGVSGVMVDANDTPQYALVKKVTIAAHPYLRPALDESVEAAKSAISRALKQQLEAIK